MDYKKILKGVVDIINNTEKSDIGFANICSYIGENCPELKEGEDERHRKWILEYLYDGLRKSDEQFKDQFKCAISWLKKQGEKPQGKSALEAIHEQKKVQASLPSFDEQQGTPVVDIEIPFGAKDSELQEASYHIPEGFHAEIQGDMVVIKKGEKKSSWSKEDEDNLTDTCVAIRKFYHGTNGAQELIDWLKFLKDRVEPQLKQQWSEEDEKMLVDLINYCDTGISYAQAECYKVEWEKRKDWLQSLKQKVKGE